MVNGVPTKICSVAQMTLYFIGNYYKMTDVNLKNFNNKVMLSKECSTKLQSGKLSTKWFHYKINLTKPEFKECFYLQDFSKLILLKMHGEFSKTGGL